jgi:hypothetical protein
LNAQVWLLDARNIVADVQFQSAMLAAHAEAFA